MIHFINLDNVLILYQYLRDKIIKEKTFRYSLLKELWLINGEEISDQISNSIHLMMNINAQILQRFLFLLCYFDNISNKY